MQTTPRCLDQFSVSSVWTQERLRVYLHKRCNRMDSANHNHRSRIPALVSLMTCRVHSSEDFDQIRFRRTSCYVVLVPRLRPRGYAIELAYLLAIKWRPGCCYMSPVTRGGGILREASSCVEGQISLSVRRPSLMREIKRAGCGVNEGPLPKARLNNSLY